MEQAFISRETVAGRAALGLVILAAHVGLMALLAAGGYVAPKVIESVSVSFLQQQPMRADKPDFPEPRLRPLQQPVIPRPEIVVPVEPVETISLEVQTETAAVAPSVSSQTTSTTGSVLPQMSEVAYVVQPSPRYPPESRRTHEQGLVVLRVVIDESGHARQVEVFRSSGHPRLDEAARAAVARAVFRPFTDGGVARASAAIVPVEFSLRGSAS
jgi:periplasmic protein TonB